MTAMELLERCRGMQADRRGLQEKIQRWYDSATRMGGGSFDSSGVHGGNGDDRMASVMAEIDRLERLLKEREQMYTTELLVANRLLDQLPELQRTIMARYYLEGMTLSAVAKAIGYSYGYVRVQKSEACAKMNRIPTKEIGALLPVWYQEAIR